MYYVYNSTIPQSYIHVGLDKFLLITDNKELYIVSLDVPHPVNVRVPLENTSVLSGVAWDSRTDTVYFSDRNLRTINSAKITVRKIYVHSRHQNIYVHVCVYSCYGALQYIAVGIPCVHVPQ